MRSRKNDAARGGAKKQKHISISSHVALQRIAEEAALLKLRVVLRASVTRLENARSPGETRDIPLCHRRRRRHRRFNGAFGLFGDEAPLETKFRRAQDAQLPAEFRPRTGCNFYRT